MSSMIWHQVREGESVYDIARQHIVPIKALMEANEGIGQLFVGQWLQIPQSVQGYVVQEGDTLEELSRQWNISKATLVNQNTLRTEELLVGQILLRQVTYTVQAGDTLFSLADKFQTTVASFEALNNVNVGELQVGQVLQIPGYTAAMTIGQAQIYDRPSTKGRVLLRPVTGARFTVTGSGDGWLKVRLFDGREGWLTEGQSRLEVSTRDDKPLALLGYFTEDEGPGLPGSEASFLAHANDLQDVSLFYYQIRFENPTTLGKFGEFTDEALRTLVAQAHARNVRVLAVVHNLLYMEGPATISKDVVKELVSSSANRQALIANILNLIRQFNFDGIDLDVEEVYEEDREGLSQFIIELGNALHQEGYFFSVAVPSKTSAEDPSAFAKPFDYAVIGGAADQVIIMLYNEHGWPGSGPGPVVSIGRMEQALTYAASLIPANKILGAVSVFGFDFNLETGKARYLTYAGAIETANQFGATIQFDEESQTPFYTYTAENGQDHEVWFENERSIIAKARLAQTLGVNGLALWRLGMEDPAIWPGLEEQFTLRKP
ncbi:LysM peptidoglycan-binding domain-containing protein [Aureibacillus halotolerans]|uniref:Spore germination protein YaaH n=1 Tax=Aureibacillus halotolerans TaxID=1508390 RepID=A0A4R6TXK0_9BACI|nr:LysM peptidoglycan-binding domain-containing protein [Aureibacillus halotolerans]TDQ38271.1 spore germination protein YaaH [Aureibacillus halotolerans]